MIKELLIIWDDDTEMFYHDYYCSELFSDVLNSVIKRYGLKGKIEGSETYSLFKTNNSFLSKLISPFKLFNVV